ncbi:MAG: glycosyltransferase, partial [Nocardioides sp.]
VRLPVQNTLRLAERQRRRRTLRAKVTQFGFAIPAQFNTFEATFQSRRRQRAGKLAELVGRHGPLVRGQLAAHKAFDLAQGGAHRLRTRAYQWEEAHRADEEAAVGDWRRDAPLLLDLEAAFVPFLERLRPDVIHANDITMLNSAAVAAARLRTRGHAVKWIYDAHEYVSAVDWPTPRLMSAYPQLERELIYTADAVVTVSPEIAQELKGDYRLPQLPGVVRNTPVRAEINAEGAPSVRETAGLDAETPLLVYSGYLHTQRGLDRAIAALPNLDDFHLAIVAGKSNAELRQLQDQAIRLGVQDRVHVVPYVTPTAVPAYLSSADIGIICSHRTLNYELSLPTKLAEYLHAGLPVIASDLRTLSKFVREHQVGEVFDPDEPLSFEAAVERLHPRRQEVSANITTALLEELSWENQTHSLLELYSRLSDRRPAPPKKAIGWGLREGPQTRESAPESTEDGPQRGAWRELSPKSTVRLGLGPANFAGQLAAYAQAVTAARSDISAEVVMHVNRESFAYPADVYVKGQALRRLDMQLEQVERVLPRYTHLLADAFRPIFGPLNGDSIAGDLPALRHAGIRVALLSHGTDARHPIRHMERNPYSLYFDAPAGFFHGRVEAVERNHRTAEESQLPIFVTTPDLLDDLPMAHWLPLVVDLESWHTDRSVFERRRPLVLHAPSRRWTKGTDRFAEALQAFADSGAIELELVEGLPWMAMRERVQNADLVIDQFAVGSYGAFACEAMAAGKPVMAYLSEGVAETLGAECPIINTTPTGIVEAISALLDDRDAAARIGQESLAYARKFHDGTRSAEVLLTHFIDQA